MKVVEKQCSTCGSPIYVYEDYVRENMFCTLHCMESAEFEKSPRAISEQSHILSSDIVQNA